MEKSDNNEMELILSQLSNISEIYYVIKEFDNILIPAISKRVGNLYLYSEKLYINAQVYCIKNKHDNVGFIAFYNNDLNTKISYISQIAVKEKMQNKSIGKELLSICLKKAKINGMQSIKLEVDNNNEKAIKFYEKNDFVYCGIATNNSVYMIKKI